MGALTSDVRAITVRQPWAWAIAHGGKTVENRSQGARHRGTLLIHAAAAWSDRGAEDRRVRGAWQQKTHRTLPLARSLSIVNDNGVPVPVFVPQALVAVAELVDVHPDAGCCRPWGESSYAEGGGRVRTAVHHLVLEGVVPLAGPIPCRGALGLWRPPTDVVTAALDGVS